MTTFADQVFQFGGVPVGMPLFFTGTSFFVKPYTGKNGNTGLTIDAPKKTLAEALSHAVANRHDVIYLLSESETASETTDYQSVALDWNKNCTHLCGIHSGVDTSPRSRIAQLSTATNVDNLFTVSASNCRIQGINVFHGVDNAASKGAVLVSGNHNLFVGCHFGGIGHATMDTVDNYSLSVTGSENTFRDCTIGLDTIARGTAVNYELLLSGGATRNKFINCKFLSYAEADTHLFVKVPVNGIDRETEFLDCRFTNMPTGVAGGTTMAQAFDITGGGSPDGLINLVGAGTSLVGVTDWETTASGKLYIITAAPTAATSGLAVVAAPS